jgi:PKD repeat protein
MDPTRKRLVAGVLVGLLAGALLGTGAVAGATATAVSLDPATTTVDAGDAATFDVVVESVDGGVGAYTATVALDDGSVAEITDIELQGSPGLSDVSIADDGSSATINAALMNTADGGSVTVATVTVQGTAPGQTPVAIDVSALGDEAGESYEVTGIQDATLSVSAPPAEQPEVTVTQTPGSETVEPGDTVAFEATVDAAGLNGPGLDVDLPAGWSVTSQSAAGPASYKPAENQWIWLSSGEYTVSYTVAVPDDASSGSYAVAAEGSGIDPATDDRLTDATESTVVVESPTPPADGDDVTVSVGSATAQAGDTASVPVTLSVAPEGLSGYTLTVTTEDGDVATVDGASYPDALGLTSSPIVSDGGGSVTLKAADIGGAVDPGATDVTLATVTLDAGDYGETALTTDIARLDDDDGSAIDASTVAGSLAVQPPSVGDNPAPTDPDGDGLYEDLNGNGEFEFDDVVTLFEHLEDPSVTDHAELYDFNDNGRIDYDDVVTLHEAV